MSSEGLLLLLICLLGIADQVACYKRNWHRKHHILKRDATPSTTLPSHLRGNPDVISTTAPNFPTVKSTTRPDFRSTTQPGFISTTRWNGRINPSSGNNTTASSSAVNSIKVTVPLSASQDPVDIGGGLAGPSGLEYGGSSASHICVTPWIILLVFLHFVIMK